MKIKNGLRKSRNERGSMYDSNVRDPRKMVPNNIQNKYGGLDELQG
jgi:hypothetical protein